ncbi:MAG: Fe-S cluster assembly protein SufD [Bacteroidetes bacterium]|nr:Fe-S cluster assembly protein SufD [Bacteroidota bacterium]
METYKNLKDKILETYSVNSAFLNQTNFLTGIRDKAITHFDTLGFPHNKLEDWRHTKLTGVLENDYSICIEDSDGNVDVNKFFHCDITDLNTYTAVLLNGWFAYKNTPITKLADGTIIASLTHALKEFPEIVKKHYGKYCDIEKNAFEALNTAFALDGIFIYVPDNVIVDKPIQIISILNKKENILVQPRNLVIVGKNSQLKLVHCDDIFSHTPTLTNSLTEIFVDENASVDHYKMQNNDNHSALIATTYFHQKANSKLSSNTITLNGGFIRNNTNVAINGENCETNLYGIYLVDGNQIIDNHTFVDHIKPNSTSNEIFKGVIDNQAKAVFSGKILVRKDAQKTNAFQTNKNILLTDEATINTKPTLEIYADDVKCSHGATVGQLDHEALFYMRSRGISEDNAKMLLMYAFTDEVITKISIEPLREKICQLVNKRLKGELSICDQCVMHCGCDEAVVFNIDMSKI